MLVLLDTNIVSYWLRGEPQFNPAVKKLVREVQKKRGTLFVSAVTIQELETGARLAGGAIAKWHQFVSAHCEVLSLSEQCALTAGKLAATVGRPAPTKAQTKAEVIDRWHRDAAIAGTAHVHALDFLATANYADFEPFQEHISCEIRRIP